MSVPGRPPQWSLTAPIIRVNGSLACREQQPDYNLVPVLGCPRQRRLIASVLRVDVSICREQQLDYGSMPVLGRPRQRRLAIPVLRVDGGLARSEKQLNHSLVAVLCCPQQRRSAMPLILRVDVDLTCRE